MTSRISLFFGTCEMLRKKNILTRIHVHFRPRKGSLNPMSLVGNKFLFISQRLVTQFILGPFRLAEVHEWSHPFGYMERILKWNKKKLEKFIEVDLSTSGIFMRCCPATRRGNFPATTNCSLFDQSQDFHPDPPAARRATIYFLIPAYLFHIFITAARVMIAHNSISNKYWCQMSKLSIMGPSENK